MRGDKVLWSGSRLITLSSRPCCRGGVRACVVCAYLGIVTWAGREVTITIRLLYPCSILRQAPTLGLQCPPFLGTKETPTIPKDNGGNLGRESSRSFQCAEAPERPRRTRSRANPSNEPGRSSRDGEVEVDITLRVRTPVGGRVRGCEVNIGDI